MGKTPAEVAAQCDITFAMLADPDAALAVSGRTTQRQRGAHGAGSCCCAVLACYVGMQSCHRRWLVDLGSWTGMPHHLQSNNSTRMQARCRTGGSTHITRAGRLAVMPFAYVGALPSTAPPMRP